MCANSDASEFIDPIRQSFVENVRSEIQTYKSDDDDDDETIDSDTIVAENQEEQQFIGGLIKRVNNLLNRFYFRHTIVCVCSTEETFLKIFWEL